MESKDWLLAGSIGLVVLLAGVLISQQYSPQNSQATGNSVVAPQAFTGDKFEGKITNTKVALGEYPGTGAYDRNCKSIGGGITNCHGGIQTQEFGLLDFNYEHNMAVQPCIAPGDKVLVTILDNSGRATVQRAY